MIRLTIMEKANAMAQFHIKLLYEDEDILVIDKPAGLLSVPDGYNSSLPSLASVLGPLYPRVWMVHRLDYETSGIMVFALNAAAHRELNRQFRERLTAKTYQCLAAPTPAWAECQMNEPLRVDADREHRTRVDFTRGKPAETQAVVLGSCVDFAWLSCAIGTGYRHQIRAHLYHHELSILGDALYHQKTQPASLPVAPRMMLHAYRLAFQHPRDGRALTLQAPLPPEFEPFLSALSSRATDAGS